MHGIDLSPQMVALAWQSFLRLSFDIGTMTDLDMPDGSLAGLVAYYSINHIPQERLRQVLPSSAGYWLPAARS